MKKGVAFFIVFALIISVILYQLKNFDVEEKNGIKTITKIENNNKVDLNQFIGLYSSGNFEKIEMVEGTKLLGYTKLANTGSQYSMMLQGTINEVYYDTYETEKPLDSSLKDLGFSLTGTTQIVIKNNEKSVIGKLFMEQILPLVVFLALLMLAFKFMGPKGGGFPFNIQAGKLKTKTEVKTRFSDVAGMEECKQELKEIVDYLKNPEKYRKVGARVPKGVLLYGPPGAGKTLLARAVAGEANVPFFNSSGSEFMEMLVGMGAAKVRELFNKAKAAAPSIIFIDEIDAIGKKRGSGFTGGHQEQEQTLNQILTEMDGFDKDTKIIVVAATNRPDTLDPALLRAGRFDRKVLVGKPTLEERLLIFKYHLGDKKISDKVDLDSLARRTSGFVGADIENIANEAALKVARDNRQILEPTDFEYALEKVIMGPEKRAKGIKEQEKKTVAFHELGHAVTAYNLPEADPVEKISIVSRGMALGVTWMTPKEDVYLYSKSKFLDEIVSLLGGRAAEEMFLGKEHITTGASNDFEKATKIASDMILKYGMDDELGTMLYLDKDRSEYTMFKPFSEKTAELIDQKIKGILSVAYEKSKKIISENKVIIEKLAGILFEKEYLSKEEFETIMKNPEAADANILDFLKTHQATIKEIEAKNGLHKEKTETKEAKKAKK